MKGVSWGHYNGFGWRTGGIGRSIIFASNAAGRSSHTGSMLSTAVRHAGSVRTARKERQGRAMAIGHSDMRRMISAAKDCLTRAEDGIDTESWGYAIDQLGKAALHISETRFLADTQKLVTDREDAVNSRLADYARRLRR